MSMTRAEVQDAARQAFGEAGPAPDAAASWTLVADMGWLMMTVPEDLGGLGLGREAAGVIHREMGRAVVPGPAIAQMLVIEALCDATGVAARADLLARAMAGEVMTAALAPGDTLSCVPDADRASHVLVRGAGQVALVSLADATMTPRATWDTTRRLFDVRLAAGAATIVLAQGDAATALSERIEAQLLFALAADSLGGADGVLTLTIDYLKVREQFGRPLAMFQALKHRVADMKTWLAAAEALFWSRATGPVPTLDEQGALKAHACGVYRDIAEDAIQLHGGIGLTMEYPAHLFLKRAMLNAALGGNGDAWDEQVGRRVLAQTV